MKTDRTIKITKDVLAEIGRQEEQWGEQNHDPFFYLAILTEEVGEAAQAALDWYTGKGEPVRLREEMVQVAAVSIAFIGCIDRNSWTWGGHVKSREMK